MVLPGHLAGGYLATRALLYFSHAGFSPDQTLALYVIGTLAGDGPDLDLAWYSFKHLVLRSPQEDNHRDYASHAPAVWLLVSLAIALVGFAAGSQFVEFVGWAVLGGSWSHLLFDSIETGVMWLWPFSRRRFCLRQVPEEDVPGTRGSARWYWNIIVKVYPRRVTLYAEIAVTLIALYVLVRQIL